MVEQTTKQNITKVVFNNLEEGFKDDFNVEYEKESDYIFFVENCRKKERKNIDKDLIPLIKKDINFWKNKRPKTKVIHFLQFKKGLAKTKEQLDILTKGQVIENPDGICFYEEFPGQNKDKFDDQLNEFVEFKPEIEKYIVLEIESEDIVEKVVLALSKGSKKFILIGGDYKNLDLWTTLTSSIREVNGETIMLLPARMHNRNKESYIKKAIEFGIDYVVHGSPFGGGNKDKERVILFLDKKDLTYKKIEKIDDLELKKMIKDTCSSKQDQYKLSRILAVDVANVFSKTYAPNKVVNT
ncbi:MAG: hypothetical protein ABH849_03920 [Nanoarchaeota archaeon]